MSKLNMRRRLSYGALAVAICAAGPVAAQSTYMMSETPTVTVQNNHHYPLTVYVQPTDNPVDTKLGTVAPMDVAAFALPEGAVQDKTRVVVGLQPEGGVPLEGDAILDDTEQQHFAVTAGHTGRVVKNESKMWTTAPDIDLMATTLTVRNETDHPTKVFVTRDAFDHRLGMVPANSEMTFAIPDGYVGESGHVELVNDEGQTMGSSMVSFEQGRHIGVRTR
jgi:hypothetical protein